MELEIEELSDASELSRQMLNHLVKDPTDYAPTGGNLKKQFCTYSEGFGLASSAVASEPERLATEIDRALARRPGNAEAQFYRNGPISPLKAFAFEDAKQAADILRNGSERWTCFGFKLTGRFHANLLASQINSNLFHYELFQPARKTLLLPNFEREPYFFGKPLTEGSVLFEIFFGAATIAGGVAAYPKIKAGMRELLEDSERLKRWFSRALDKERAFKRLGKK